MTIALPLQAPTRVKQSGAKQHRTAKTITDQARRWRSSRNRCSWCAVPIGAAPKSQRTLPGSVTTQNRGVENRDPETPGDRLEVTDDDRPSKQPLARLLAGQHPPAIGGSLRRMTIPDRQELQSGWRQKRDAPVQRARPLEHTSPQPRPCAARSRAAVSVPSTTIIATWSMTIATRIAEAMPSAIASPLAKPIEEIGPLLQ